MMLVVNNLVCDFMVGYIFVVCLKMVMIRVGFV